MKFTRKYIKPVFFSSEDPNRIKVPYVISFIMISLTITSVIIQLCIIVECYHRNIEARWNLVPLISVLMASAGGFVALYNQGTKNKGEKHDREI